MSEKQYQNLKSKKNKDKGTLDIDAEIPVEVLAQYRKEALEEIKEGFETDGFRKGKAPEDVVVKNVGEPKILQKAAENALDEIAPQILQDEEIWALGSPQVMITKIAPGDDLGFKMRIALPPEVKLPNYKKLAKEAIKKQDVSEDVVVTDEDVDAVINQLRAMRAQGEGGDMPELNDEFAKQVGFDDVATLKKKVRENTQQEKKMEQKKKLREAIIQKIVEEADITVPEMVISQEVGLIRSRFYQELDQANMTMEDYLERSGMSEDELDESHRQHVNEQLQAKFVVEEIAEEEGIEPDEDEMEQQRQILKMRHPEASDSQIDEHLKSALTHEKVFQFLENQLVEA